MVDSAPFSSSLHIPPSYNRNIEDRYLKELITLKVNSKPLINSLTMMAEDVIEWAPTVVFCIEKHLSRVSVKPEHKLPVLYLLDSIVKNIKKDYVSLFEDRIDSIFSGVFEKVEERTRTQMFKLRQTWNDIFSAKKLHALDLKCHAVDKGWPVSPGTSSTIHVNPKFLKPTLPSLQPSIVSPSYDPNVNSLFTLSPLDINSLTDKDNGAVTEAEMREQLLIKQKQLLELQTKKLELELMQTQAQLEKKRQEKEQEEREMQESLFRQAELAKQQTKAATNIIANAKLSLFDPDIPTDPRTSRNKSSSESKPSTTSNPSPTHSHSSNSSSPRKSSSSSSPKPQSQDRDSPSDKGRDRRTDKEKDKAILNIDFKIKRDKTKDKDITEITSPKKRDKNIIKNKSEEEMNKYKEKNREREKSSRDKDKEKTKEVTKDNDKEKLKSPRRESKDKDLRKDSKGRKDESIKHERNSNSRSSSKDKIEKRDEVEREKERTKNVLSRSYRKRPVEEEDSTPNGDILFNRNADVDQRTPEENLKGCKLSPPSSKKSKSSNIDNLFGRQDVDLRQGSSGPVVPVVQVTTGNMEIIGNVSSPPHGPNPFVEAANAALVPFPKMEIVAPVPHLIPSIGSNPFTASLNIPEVRPIDLEIAAADTMKSIPIDQVQRLVRFYNEVAVVFLGPGGDEPHQISFQRDPRTYTVLINHREIKCRMGQDKFVVLDGIRYNVRLGAPTREVYIDEIGYEVCFKAKEKQVRHKGRLLTLALPCAAPSVEVGEKPRYDLVAGIIGMIMDGKQIPVYLDEKPQLLEFYREPVIVQFTDEFCAVTFNGVKLPTLFDGIPRHLTLPSGHLITVQFPPISPFIITNIRRHIEERKQNVITAQQRFDGPRERIGRRQRPDRNVLRDHPRRLLPNNEQITSVHHRSNIPPMDSNGDSQHPTRNNDPITATNENTGPFLSNLNVQDLLNKLMMAGILPKTEGVPSTEHTKEPEKLMEPQQLPLDTKPEPQPMDVDIQPQQSQSMVNITFSDNLKERRDQCVDALYGGSQCGTCGLRFPPDQSVRHQQHLDWHFRENGRAKQKTRRVQSRKWYYTLSDWLQYEEIADTENQNGNRIDESEMETENEVELNPSDYTVLAEGRMGTKCPQCHENFEEYFDDENEEWRLRKAVLQEDTIFHPNCYKDLMESRQSQEAQAAVEEVEEDEVLIIKEGPKEKVLMNIVLDDEDEGISEKVCDIVTDNSTEKQVNIEPSIDKVTTNTSSEIPDSPIPNNCNPSYRVLSPIVIGEDSDSDSNIPGLADLDATDSSGIFGFALSSSSTGGRKPRGSETNDSKSIVYESWKFDFPKIKEEPIEWADVDENEFVNPFLVQPQEGEPEEVTLDDDEVSNSPAKLDVEPEPSSSPKQTVSSPTPIDLTEDDDSNTFGHGLVAEMDGNFQFKESSQAKTIGTKIRINIAGLDTLASVGSPKPKEDVESESTKSPLPPTETTSPSPSTFDLDKILQSDEVKTIKPRLYGKKLVNQPTKRTKAESSGLCVIC